MTSELVTTALRSTPTFGSRMSLESMVSHEQMRGEKVSLFRDYQHGDHRADLTTEMRNLLRIRTTGSMNEFNDNYMDVVIQSMADRLKVASIQGDDEAATTWAADLLKRIRFDAMQTDVHEATIRDGDSYVLAHWDNNKKEVCFSHEQAFDGVDGMMVFYSTSMDTIPAVAIKIWHITLDKDKVGSASRVNVYYADRVERFVSLDSQSQLVPYTDANDDPKASWTVNGEPIGMPVIPFRNRGRQYGVSEIENAIPLQDALNRALYSTVMTAELTGFQIRYLFGAEAPSGITPGMWINGAQEYSGDEQLPMIGVLPVGEIAPFLALMQHLVNEIGNVTNTPRLTPQGMGGDSASGESLKQREIGLLGKINRFQVKAGNAWEDLMKLSARIQTAFGSGAPSLDAEFTVKWASAEIRNDDAAIATAIQLAPFLDERTFLELIAPKFDWDNDKIDAIMAAKKTESAEAMAQQQQQAQPLPNSATTPQGRTTLNDIMKRAGVDMGNGTAQQEAAA